MIEYINRIEKGIYAVLMAMLVVVLVFAIFDLATVLLDALINGTPGLIDTHEMITVLGGFLLVLIGVELLDTIKAYFRENTIHVEIVLLLAIIAIARKVILLDPSSMTGYEFGVEMMGIGVIIVGLAGGYFMIKKAGITAGPAVGKETG